MIKANVNCQLSCFGRVSKMLEFALKVLPTANVHHNDFYRPCPYFSWAMSCIDKQRPLKAVLIH